MHLPHAQISFCSSTSVACGPNGSNADVDNVALTLNLVLPALCSLRIQCREDGMSMGSHLWWMVLSIQAFAVWAIILMTPYNIISM